MPSRDVSTSGRTSRTKPRSARRPSTVGVDAAEAMGLTTDQECAACHRGSSSPLGLPSLVMAVVDVVLLTLAWADAGVAVSSSSNLTCP